MKNNLFPKKINDFHFLREYKTSGKSKSNVSKFSLYRDSNTKLAFAKSISVKWVWEKYWLKNEIIICPKINSIPDKKLKVYTPKILGKYEELNHSVILFEFIKGKTLGAYNLKYKIRTLDRVLNYIEKINKSRSFTKVKSKLTKRNNFYFLALFPLFLTRAVIKNATVRYSLAKIIYQYLLSFYYVLGNSKIKFIHRDLNDSNIIISNKNIYVIDFQSSLLSDVRFEISNIAINFWKDNKFGKEFYKLDSVNRIIDNNTSLQIYKFYSLYASIFEIGNKGTGIEPWLLQYFRHSLSLKFNPNKEISYV